MQDNPFNEKFMNEAWSDMQAQLEVAMPAERKRRILVWWWLLGAAIILMAVAVLVVDFPYGKNAERPVEKIKETPPIALEESGSVEVITPNPGNQEALYNSSSIIEKRGDNTEEYTTTLTTKNEFANPIETKENSNTPNIQKRNSKELISLAPIEIQPKRNDFLKLSFTQTKFSLQKENKKIAGSFHAYSATSYEFSHEDFNYQLGVGWKQILGRSYLRVEPSIQLGKSAFAPATKDGNFALEAKQEDSSTNPGTSFQPNNSAEEQVREIQFSYTTFRVPLTVGYQLGEKWSLESGVAWNYVQSMRALHALNEASVQQVYGNTTANIGIGDTDLKASLSHQSFIQGQMVLNFEPVKNLEIQAAYQHSFTKVLPAENWEWNRNYLTLGLRYRINSYILGKK